MPDFYTVVTDSGLQALRQATTQGQSFTLSHAVLGDGNGNPVIPNKGMTALVHEVWRGEINGFQIDPDDANTIIFEFVVPADIGGFTVRELGLLDEDGTMYCVGNFPDTVKPVAANGSVRDLVIRLPLHFENANEVTIVINAAVALATKQDVIDHNADPQAHRLATEEQTGFARFATDAEHVAHTRKNIAATPWGVWKLLEAVKSDAVDLASSLRLATSQAVKSVMDALIQHKNSTGDVHDLLPNGGTVGDCLKLAAGAKLEWGDAGLSTVDFPCSKNTSGWQKLPSGIILQWGNIARSGNITHVVFPLSFPHEAFQCVANNRGSVSGYGDIATMNLVKNGFDIMFDAHSEVQKARWFAIGY